MKILIVNNHMEMGGIRTSLLNLLGNLKISGSEYEIDLLLLKEAPDEILAELKALSVRVLPSPCLTNIFYHSIRSQSTVTGRIIKLFMVLTQRLFGNKKVIRFLVGKEKELCGYDIAISFANGIWKNGERNYVGGCEDFLLRRVKAAKKIAWIHSMPRNLGFTREICMDTYNGFDLVVNVSSGCKELFDRMVPEYSYKSKVVYNFCNIEKIRALALKEAEQPEWDGFRIVTAARLKNDAKRIDRMIDACAILKQRGVKFQWLIVGDGADRSFLLEYADEKAVADRMLFLGRHKNPYPYMKNADLFVLASDFEAFPMSLYEAMILGTPVICTNIPAAKELIADGENGIIVDFDAESLAAAIEKLWRERDTLKFMKQKLEEKKDYNAAAMMQLKEILTLE